MARTHTGYGHAKAIWDKLPPIGNKRYWSDFIYYRQQYLHQRILQDPPPDAGHKGDELVPTSDLPASLQPLAELLRAAF